jgi:hypothetical protein
MLLKTGQCQLIAHFLRLATNSFYKRAKTVRLHDIWHTFMVLKAYIQISMELLLFEWPPLEYQLFFQRLRTMKPTGMQFTDPLIFMQKVYRG